MSLHATECPKCHATASRVVESRRRKIFSGFRRRRECSECNYRYWTVETLELDADALDVVKKCNG